MNPVSIFHPPIAENSTSVETLRRSDVGGSNPDKSMRMVKFSPWNGLKVENDERCWGYNGILTERSRFSG